MVKKKNKKGIKAAIVHQTQVLVEQTRVTSPPKQLNTRDHLIAWFSSLVGTVILVITSIIGTVCHLLASIADYVLPYLQQMARQEKPAWIAVLTFLVMGLVILNKRRIAGADYKPPPPLPPVTIPVPVTNPTQPSTPAPQTPPPPVGTPVDTTKSAF